jgi:hypothetical protein
VDAAADLGVRNSQPEGVGRVVAFEDLVCWNNLGRSVVFADNELRPLAVFGTTLFPGQDDPSQYDLDVHAVLDLAELQSVVVLNHIGAVRSFCRDDIFQCDRLNERLVEPASLWWFAADVERTVAVGGCLVGSAPRSEGAQGLLVSVPLSSIPDRESIPTRPFATAFGEVTALCVAASPHGPLIGVGGVGKVTVFPFLDGRIGPASWDVAVGFRVANMAWSDDLLWAAGPDQAESANDYDWESLAGGGFAALDPADGRIMMSGPLPLDVAWGTGGVAVAPFGRSLVAAGRTGCVHLIDPSDGADLRSTAPLAKTSLGIAHLAVAAGRVLCGFNRGGYRLHAFAQTGFAQTGFAQTGFAQTGPGADGL